MRPVPRPAVRRRTSPNVEQDAAERDEAEVARARACRASAMFAPRPEHQDQNAPRAMRSAAPPAARRPDSFAVRASGTGSPGWYRCSYDSISGTLIGGRAARPPPGPCPARPGRTRPPGAGDSPPGEEPQRRARRAVVDLVQRGAQRPGGRGPRVGVAPPRRTARPRGRPPPPSARGRRRRPRCGRPGSRSRRRAAQRPRALCLPSRPSRSSRAGGRARSGSARSWIGPSTPARKKTHSSWSIRRPLP